MHKSPSMPLMCGSSQPGSKPLARFAGGVRSASANCLPSLVAASLTSSHDSPAGGRWGRGGDMAELVEGAYTVVPMNTLIKCSAAHTFPMSLLSDGSGDADEDDARSMALCLASPFSDEEPKKETQELQRLVRRVSYASTTFARRRKWAQVLRRRKFEHQDLEVV